MIKLYGIPNCDTVKKARDQLYLKGCNDFEFINLKKLPLSKELILKWKRAFDYDWPINTRSRTYREFKEEFEEADDDRKIELIQENPSAIKRPILEIHGKVISVGYNEARYSVAIKKRDDY